MACYLDRTIQMLVRYDDAQRFNVDHNAFQMKRIETCSYIDAMYFWHLLWIETPMENPETLVDCKKLLAFPPRRSDCH